VEFGPTGNSKNMTTVVILLVAIAALQGIYNLVREAHHEFELVDPADTVEEAAPQEQVPRQRAA
jgi:hypothetical protein